MLALIISVFTNTHGPRYPEAPNSTFTLASLKYPDGAPVVGSVGPAMPLNFSNPLARGSTFWRGVTDLHGDEWHRITFGDDDAMVREAAP